MGRIGFWQLLLDDNVSWWEARAINEAHDTASAAYHTAAANSAGLSELSQRLAHQSREIVMLRTALTVLVNTLRDTGVVDARLLDARLEAAMEEAMAPRAPAPKAAAPTAPALVTCIRCREHKPASATNMTADGPICDPCSYK